MEVAVDVNKVLEMTRQRLADVSNENVVLHCVVEDQQAEINQLKEVIDKLGEEGQHGKQDEGE